MPLKFGLKDLGPNELLVLIPPNFSKTDRGEPVKLPNDAFSFPGDNKPIGDPLRGVEVLAYLGGVLNFEPGVWAAERGDSPRSFRCAGVRGISARSSVCRKRGRKAMIILYTRIA